uniref:WD domain, G-beta repeat containing protein n=1 Tax=Babesia bovis TaxID=5865 RepID=A7AU25_BABBO|eukprot:XP_001610004.1 WD domain, G-beta repeat containing protein [Babesia bovis T2Bo]
MDPSSDHGQLSYQLSYSLDFPSSVPRSGCVINNRTLDVGRETHEAILDNEYLLIGDADGVVRVWRITPHSTVEVLNDIICHEGAVMDVVGSSLTDATVDLDAYQEGAMSITAVEATLSFFTCGRDHKIHRVNFLGQRLTTYVGHSDVVCSLQEFDRGQRLVSGSWDGTAIVWDVSTGSMLYRVGGNTYKYSVYCNVLPNGDLVTAMTNGDLCIWNNGTLRKTLQAHSGVIRAVSIKDDTILTCSNDCSVRCFNGNMESLYTIPAAHENFVYDVRHSMYVPIFFTASEDKTVGIWDLVSGRQLQLIHLDSSIWKVVETCQGICIIPMSGNVSIWQRLPGCDLTLHPPQVVS